MAHLLYQVTPMMKVTSNHSTMLRFTKQQNILYVYIMGSNPQKNLNLIFIQVCYRLHCKRFLAVSPCAPPTCTFSCIKLLDLSSSWLCTGFMFTKKNKIILIQKCNKKERKSLSFCTGIKQPTTKTYLLILQWQIAKYARLPKYSSTAPQDTNSVLQLDVRVQKIPMLIPQKNLSPKTQKISTPKSPQIS